MTVDADYDDEEIMEEEPVRRRSPLRLILIILLILVGVCIICYLLSQILGPNLLSRLPISIPGLPAAETATPTPALAVTDTPTPPVPTEEGEATPTETSSPIPVTEEPTAELTTTPEIGELPATTEPTATEEIIATTEPTGELVEEHGEVPIDTPTPTATTAPVPGPTATLQPGATPGPTETVAAAECEPNTPPTAQANGPYTAMMGKGQAFVIFEATGSTDPDGTITRYEWDFGDGSAPETGQSVTHGYSSTGTYVATLTVTDNCNATNEATADVTITGPTPPATGTPTPPANGNGGTPVPTATSQASQIDGTMGFCHLVTPGDTLFGIAQRYGVAVPDLALVNGVTPDYFVITGQGLFIPTGQIEAGPNVYQVQAGDTLDSIAFQCGLNPAILADANGLGQNQDLSPGEFIIIPLWR